MKNRVLAVCILILISATILSACSGAESSNNPPIRTVNNEPVSRDRGGSAAMNGMFPLYTSSDELFDRATDVFRGKVIDSREERVNLLLSAAEVIEYTAIVHGRYHSREEIRQLFMDEYYRRGFWCDTVVRYRIHLMTIYRIRVLEVFQGNYQIGDIVEVAQHAGSNSPSFRGFIPLEADDDIVIFMVSMDRFGQPGYFLTPWQSVYFFPADEGRSGKLSLEEELKPVIPGSNRLNLTLNDLIQLSPFENFSIARNGEWEPTYAPPAERQVWVIPTPLIHTWPPTPWPYEIPDPTPYAQLEPSPTLPPLDENYVWYFPSPSCPPIAVYRGPGPTLSPEAIANPPSPSPSSD